MVLKEWQTRQGHFSAAMFTRLWSKTARLACWYPNELHEGRGGVVGQQASLRAQCPAGIDMNVSILTSGYWPTYPAIEAKLPQELNQYQQVCGRP